MTGVDQGVELIAWTKFQTPPSVLEKWQPDGHPNGAGDGEDLIEFSGRACYESWDRPNAATASNAGYIGHIIDVGHWSVIEHAIATFYFTGVSRSLTHELVRHRHFSYSQLSQRYVDSADANYVVPPEAEGDEELEALLSQSFDSDIAVYDEIYELMYQRLTAEGVSGTERRKRARQAARAKMANMTETKIVMTGNYRAWAHFVYMRAAAPADHEIRRLAVAVLRKLQAVAPAVFGQYKIVQLADGTEAAEGPQV